MALHKMLEQSMATEATILCTLLPEAASMTQQPQSHSQPVLVYIYNFSSISFAYRHLKPPPQLNYEP